MMAAMRKLKALVVLAATWPLLAWAVACGWDTVSPAATQPVPGNPCGNLGVPCLDDAGAYDHMCCWEGETCGGGKYEVGCPAGMCCDIREPPFDELRAPGDGGPADAGRATRARDKQWRP